MKKERNSNIELLRILSIIFIVISHYCVHGAGRIAISSLNIGINRFILEVFTLGNLGTVLFVLISGYYLINSDKFKLKKLIHLIFQVLFYSVLIYLLFCLFRLNTFSIKGLITSFLPITFKKYWFITAYIVLYIFHPYINKLLNTFNKKEHLKFIYLLLLIFSLLSTITTQNYYGNEIIYFLIFYSIGAYFNKYPNNYFNKNKYKTLLISILIIVLSIISFDLLGTKYDFFNSHSIYLLNITSPFVILIGCSLFSIFINKPIIKNDNINFISSLILGVYLISDNEYIRSVLWNDLLRCNEYINSPFLLIHLIISIILVIIICLMIEMIRKNLIENILFEKLDNKIDDIQNNLELKVNKN